MKRLLCIWFPNWPIQRFLVDRPEFKGQPRNNGQETGGPQHRVLVLFGRDPRRGQLVVACSRTARRQGVQTGMPLPEATALIERGTTADSRSPTARGRQIRSGSANLLPEDHLAKLGIWPHRPADDQQALERLVAWAEAFSPLVGLDQDDPAAGLLLDVTGVAQRHGGEWKLVEQLNVQLRQQGYWGQFGLADTLGAAWALAHGGHDQQTSEGTPGTRATGKSATGKSATGKSATGKSAGRLEQAIHIAPPGKTRQAIGPLPVAALRLSDTVLDWLRELGVQRIEQLDDLPRAGISSRLGSEVLRRWDQAVGICQETLVTHHLPPPFVTQWHAEHPTDQYEAIERVVEHLSHHLAQRLSDQQRGALQLRCRLFCEPRIQPSDCDLQARAKLAPIELDVSLFQPTPQASYLWQLLRTQLEQIQLPGPVATVELLAVATGPLHQHQAQLWGTDPTETDSQQLANLIDGISNRLGPQVVTAARLRAGALPESAYVLIPLAGPEASRARLSAGLNRTPPVPGHRPLQLLDPPVPVQMLSQSAQGAPQQFVATGHSHHIDRVCGPERVETAWWRGPCVRRDYYRVHCTSGAWWWLFQDLHDRQWFLHGEFI